MNSSETPSVCRVCGHSGDFDPVDPVRRLFRCADCRQMIQGDGSAWLNPFKSPPRPQRKRSAPWWTSGRRRSGP